MTGQNAIAFWRLGSNFFAIWLVTILYFFPLLHFYCHFGDILCAGQDRRRGSNRPLRPHRLWQVNVSGVV